MATAGLALPAALSSTHTVCVARRDASCAVQTQAGVRPRAVSPSIMDSTHCSPSCGIGASPPPTATELGARSSAATERLAPYPSSRHQSWGIPPFFARCAWPGAPRRGNDDAPRRRRRGADSPHQTWHEHSQPSSMAGHASFGAGRPAARCVRETLTARARCGAQWAELFTLHT